jgi:hypothetical protein
MLGTSLVAKIERMRELIKKIRAEHNGYPMAYGRGRLDVCREFEKILRECK